MNSASPKRIAFLGGYEPRRCGIATFTTDLCDAISVAAPSVDCFAGAMNDRVEGHRYSPRVRFELLEKDISSQFCKEGDTPDFIHLFAITNKEFEEEMKKIKKNMKPTTIIWVSWYKKSARIPTDITEDVIRNYALRNDLVDVKVCAVSDVWSGLKLVVPLPKR